MNPRRQGWLFLFSFTLSLVGLSAVGQTLVTPMMGGGQVAADMVHIDLYYDAEANQLQAHLDDSAPMPELRPLEPGYAFDSQQPWAVIQGKAYNAQYGWNVGGFFMMPAGAAIWIELVDASPALETYEGWGRTGVYTPIFGTAGSSRLWKWNGVMVHNTYAVLNPVTDRLFAEYHIFFGDADTGARTGFTDLDDAFVRLEWKASPVEDPFTLKFGAVGQTNGAPLSFLNADQFVAAPPWVLALSPVNPNPGGPRFEGALSMAALPATEANGGPAPGHAALGSCIEFELTSLAGPVRSSLSFWEPDETEPRWSAPVGTGTGAHRIRISQGEGAPGSDPFGRSRARRLTVDQPGLYSLGFRLVDTSTQGSGGGPIHAPSATYVIYAQAGFTVGTVEKQGQALRVGFGGVPGKTLYLEATPAVGSSSWQTVAGPLSGTNRLQSFTLPWDTMPHRFLRLRSE